MSLRPRLKKTQTLSSRPTAASYQLTPITLQSQHHRNALVVLPNSIELTQNSALPPLPGQIGLCRDGPVARDDLDCVEADSAPPVIPFTEPEVFGGTDVQSPSKHRVKCLEQWEQWTTEILPELILPFLELQCKTHTFCKDAPLDLVSQACNAALVSRNSQFG